MEDGRDVARAIDRRHVTASGRRHVQVIAARHGPGQRRVHLQQVKPHPRVFLGHDLGRRHAMVFRVPMLAAVHVDLRGDARHLPERLRRRRRRPQPGEIQELEHVHDFDDVHAAVVGKRGAGQLVAAISPARRLIEADVVSREVVGRDDAARRAHDGGVLLREVPLIEVLVALGCKAPQRVGRALLHDELARVEHPPVRKKDLTALLGPAEHVRRHEHLAPEEGMDLEAVARVGDGRGAEVLRRLGPELLTRRLVPGPEPGHAGAEPGRRRVRPPTRELRHGRVHAAVDVVQLAGRGLVVEETQDAGDAGHVRLDDGLGHRGGERGVGRVAAGAKDVRAGPRRERMRADDEAAHAGRDVLAAEHGPGNQPPPFLWRHRPWRAALGGGRRALTAFEGRIHGA